MFCDHYDKKPTTIPTLGLRMNPNIASAGFYIDIASEFRVPDEAPWLLQNPRVRLGLTRLNKLNINDLEYKHAFL